MLSAEPPSFLSFFESFLQKRADVVSRMHGIQEVGYGGPRTNTNMRSFARFGWKCNWSPIFSCSILFDEMNGGATLL